MEEEKLREMSGLFSKVIRERDNQGYAVRTHNTPDYSSLMINELSDIENGNPELSEELHAVSRFIRKELWKDNSRELSIVLHHINCVYQYIAEIIKEPLIFNFEFLIEYIRLLARYRLYYYCDIDILKFEELIDKVILIRNGKVIKNQWDDVLSGGMDTFMKVFDDVFTTAFETYPDAFFISLNENGLLSRCVHEVYCNEDRFIPWPNKVHNNRWNPPGKTFLYTALKDQNIIGCPSDISGGEYICLHECRTKAGTNVCFCDFKIVREGKIIDLSYNDVSLYSYRHMLDEEADRNVDGILSVLLNDQVLFAHHDDRDFMEARITAEMINHPISERVLMVSIAKQYLKGICDCIYTKVDEDSKERAYKSFHLLANYLETKSVTGIIYPCTRLLGMTGKNVVLFNIHDAEPVTGSVRHYHNEVDCT